MATQLDSTEVKMGTVIPVLNTEKKNTLESNTYYALKIEDHTGDNEEWLLFTAGEVRRLIPKTMDEVASKWKPGRIVYRFGDAKGANWINVLLVVGPVTRSWSLIPGRPSLIHLPDSMLKRARERAKANPEDIPKMSWLQDLRD